MSKQDVEEFDRREKVATQLISVLQRQVQHLQSKLQLNQQNDKDDEKIPDDSITLFYWQGLTNRGNRVRLILNEAGVRFDEVNDPGEVTKLVRLTKGDTPDDQQPVFVVPMIKFNGTYLSQHLGILRYVAKRYNLYPRNELEGLRAEMLQENLEDLFGESWVLRAPTDNVESLQNYLFAKDGRIARYLGLFNDVLSRRLDCDTPYFFEDRITYVDLILFNTLNGLKETMNRGGINRFDNVLSRYNFVNELYNTLLDNEKISDLLKEQSNNKMSYWPWELPALKLMIDKFSEVIKKINSKGEIDTMPKSLTPEKTAVV